MIEIIDEEGERVEEKVLLFYDFMKHVQTTVITKDRAFSSVQLNHTKHS